MQVDIVYVFCCDVLGDCVIEIIGVQFGLFVGVQNKVVLCFWCQLDGWIIGGIIVGGYGDGFVNCCNFYCGFVVISGQKIQF